MLDLILQGSYQNYDPDPCEIAELYREIGLLKDAKSAIKNCSKDYFGIKEKVIEGLIDESITAPARYKI